MIRTPDADPYIGTGEARFRSHVSQGFEEDFDVGRQPFPADFLGTVSKAEVLEGEEPSVSLMIAEALIDKGFPIEFDHAFGAHGRPLPSDLAIHSTSAETSRLFHEVQGTPEAKALLEIEVIGFVYPERIRRALEKCNAWDSTTRRRLTALNWDRTADWRRDGPGYSPDYHDPLIANDLTRRDTLLASPTGGDPLTVPTPDEIRGLIVGVVDRILVAQTSSAPQV